MLYRIDSRMAYSIADTVDYNTNKPGKGVVLEVRWINIQMLSEVIAYKMVGIFIITICLIIILLFIKKYI